MPMQRRELLNTCGALSVAVLAGVQVAEAAESRFCSPEDPLQALMEGNRRFSRAWQDAATNPSTDLSVQLHGNRCFNPPGDLIDGQQPWATVLTCADSRVSPSWIFDTTPGELFVIRNAGNTAFTEAIASVEYSVSVLNTPLVMVMGHSGCGAVTSAMGGDDLSPSLERLLNPIREQISDSTTLDEAIRRNARGTAAKLLKQSDLLSQAEADGRMRLVVSCFDLTSGAVILI